MFTVGQKIGSLRIIIHLIIFISFTLLLSEWALGLAVSAFSRCYINKIAEKTYHYMKRLIVKEH